MSSSVLSPPWGVWCRCELSRDPRSPPAQFPAGREGPVWIALSWPPTTKSRTVTGQKPSRYESLVPCTLLTSTVFPPPGSFADSDAPRGSPGRQMWCFFSALMAPFAEDSGRGNDADPITNAPPWPHSLILSALSCSPSDEPAPMVLSRRLPTSCPSLSANWSESCSGRPTSPPGLFLAAH